MPGCGIQFRTISNITTFNKLAWSPNLSGQPDLSFTASESPTCWGGSIRQEP
jgi:hypothetical protein